jgi:hypothetical protein
MGALHDPPAEVETGGAGPGHVDLLPVVLADVTDPEVAGAPIEREAERVAEAIEPDLSAGAGCPDERVPAGDRVVRAARGVIDVDPQDLAEQAPRFWARFPGSPPEPPSPRAM